VESVVTDKQKYLGEFEHILLLALIKLAEEAYGTRIRQMLKIQIGRDVSIGALYATLERMEGKGLVSSSLGEATAERGGRAKRYFEVTAKGRIALQRSRSAIDIMWQGVSLSTGTQAV
jgi:PadR family transcriptional regulator PadR